jgi:hypothetical protein
LKNKFINNGGPVRNGPFHGPARSTVRSTGRHGTGWHGPFSGEGRTDPLLDRTVVGHGTVHGPATVRSGLVHFKPLVMTSSLVFHHTRSAWFLNMVTNKGMFGWHKNIGITVVFGIEIVMVQINVNLLFRNSENSCCSAISRRRWNNCCSS